MSDRRDEAFYELIRHVAYSDTWLRHARCLQEAMELMGMHWDRKGGLMQGNTTIPSPYDNNY